MTGAIKINASACRNKKKKNNYAVCSLEESQF